MASLILKRTQMFRKFQTRTLCSAPVEVKDIINDKAEAFKKHVLKTKVKQLLQDIPNVTRSCDPKLGKGQIRVSLNPVMYEKFMKEFDFALQDETVKAEFEKTVGNISKAGDVVEKEMTRVQRLESILADMKANKRLVEELVKARKKLVVQSVDTSVKVGNEKSRESGWLDWFKMKLWGTGKV